MYINIESVTATNQLLGRPWRQNQVSPAPPTQRPTFVLREEAALGPGDVVGHAVGDTVAARLEVARPRRRPLPPRPVGALGVLRARPPARRSRRLRVLAPHHTVVAEVRRVVLEAGAVAAKLSRRVGALGRGRRVGEHDAAAAGLALAALAAAAAAGLLPFGCGRIVRIQSRELIVRHQDVPYR